MTFALVPAPSGPQQRAIPERTHHFEVFFNETTHLRRPWHGPQGQPRGPKDVAVSLVAPVAKRRMMDCSWLVVGPPL